MALIVRRGSLNFPGAVTHDLRRPCLPPSPLPSGAPVQHTYSGKVRDQYADRDDLILVASDRMSIFDVVLPTPIPDKGKILTQLSLWWFGQLADTYR